MSKFDFLMRNSFLRTLYRHANGAEKFYEAKNYEICAFKCRKTLDLAIQLVMEDDGRSYEGVNLKTVVDWMYSQEYLTAIEYEKVLDVINIGNQAVHSNIDISQKEARIALESLKYYLAELNATSYSDYDNTSSAIKNESLDDIENAFLRAEEENVSADNFMQIENTEEKQAIEVKTEVREAPMESMDAEQLLAEGRKYINVNGVVTDMKLVRKYWNAAAEKGDLNAELAMGNLLEGVYGGIPQYPEAKGWYEKAALKGSAEAQFKLGYFAENAYGGKQDYRKARKYYEQAIEQNHGEAFYRLGLIYEQGKKVKIDIDKAHEYYKLALDNGCEEARKLLENHSETLKKQITSATKTNKNTILLKAEMLSQSNQHKDRAKAVALYRQAAKKGDICAKKILADMCIGSNKKDKNVKGIKLYLSIIEEAENGCIKNPNTLANTYYDVGKCYAAGIGTEKDIRQAFLYYNLAFNSFEKFNIKDDDLKGQLAAKLAIGYEQGEVTTIDLEKAIMFYEMAYQLHALNSTTSMVNCKNKLKQYLWEMNVYEDGTAEELYKMFNLCKSGSTLIKKDENDIKYLSKAAELGLSEAQYDLGIYYKIRMNPVYIEWLTKAAEGGCTKAQIKVARDYEDEYNENFCLEKAIYFYQKALKKGMNVADDIVSCENKLKILKEKKMLLGARDSKGLLALGMKCEGDHKVKRKDRIALDCYENAAALGNKDAQYKVALCYEEGKGTSINEKKAFELYKNMAELGDVRARYKVALYYEERKGTSINEKKVLELYKSMAELGDVKAQYKVDLYYEKGKGTPINNKKVFELYKSMAELGDAKAQYKVALCYEKGKGTIKNEEMAMKFYLQAAEKGNLDAQYDLASIYEDGNIVSQDLEKSLYWYEKALANGYAYAENNIQYVKSRLKYQKLKNK